MSYVLNHSGGWLLMFILYVVCCLLFLVNRQVPEISICISCNLYKVSDKSVRNGKWWNTFQVCYCCAIINLLLHNDPEDTFLKWSPARWHQIVQTGLAIWRSCFYGCWRQARDALIRWFLRIWILLCLYYLLWNGSVHLVLVIWLLLVIMMSGILNGNLVRYLETFMVYRY